MTDQGIGIELKSQDKIFDQYGDILRNPKKKKDGAGLGLTICKRIVE